MRAHFSLLSSFSIAVALLGGCSSSPTEPDLRTQDRVLVVAPLIARIAGGGSLQLYVRVPGSNESLALSPELVWSSSNEQVAGVTAHGVVTGRNSGTAEIVARWKGRRGVSQITVEATSIPNLKPPANPKKCPVLLMSSTKKRVNPTSTIPTCMER
jgi:hypothetical protein